jgi:hypothetical protein
MIHYSNPTCDTCGERHADGHPLECIEVLVTQRDEAIAECAELRRQIGGLRAVVEQLQDEIENLIRIRPACGES